ncbi:hypothetical protein ACF1HG_35275 [Streptomyces globisporus]|uniref:hypothetical protein n=1 Tax=Streptomyces globisporus TaxID=1908 RepID=UPI0036FB2A8D
MKSSEALERSWRAGKKPDSIVLRSILLKSDGDRSKLTKLVRSRGVALRFYLLAVFEAQCRLSTGDPWQNALPLKGDGSWSDLIAIDGAYNNEFKTYDTELEDIPPDLRSSPSAQEARRQRKLKALRLQQVKGALRTLEELGQENALVVIPRGAREQRLYESFSLMQESGRGDGQDPDLYTVPAPDWAASRVITLPKDFFLNGWIQVLSPSEVATWIVLRFMSQWAPRKHHSKGVFLTTRTRMEAFGLRDDAWEDGCQRLRGLGLIRHATEPPEVEAGSDPVAKALFSQPIHVRQPYEPHRWQMTDEGLAKDAVQALDRELVLEQQAAAAKHARRRIEHPTD